VALIEFPKQVSEFPSIIKYFPEEESAVSEEAAWLIGISSSVMDYNYPKSLEEVFPSQFINLRGIKKRPQNKYYITRIIDNEPKRVLYSPGVCLEYEKVTQKGDCGKLIVQPINSGSQMIIAGIHQAGSPVKSIASMIL
jgi:hypothetical protein